MCLLFVLYYTKCLYLLDWTNVQADINLDLGNFNGHFSLFSDIIDQTNN